MLAQIGSKRKYIDKVLGMAKEKHIDSVFDPCAGAAHLPIAVGEEKDAKLFPNDLNPVNYYYLKRKCGGEKLSDANFKEWKGSPNKDGYFTNNFSKPKKNFRSYIDGLVENTDFWLKKAYLSDLLRRGFHPRI